MDGLQRHKPDYNIKMAAEMSGTTPNLIRAYERMGLIRPYRNPGNRYRFFTLDEVEWIGRIKKLIGGAGLNIEGIRCLLTVSPCHEERQCSLEAREECPVYHNYNSPCWSFETRHACCSTWECYCCPHYIGARNHRKLFYNGKD